MKCPFNPGMPAKTLLKRFRSDHAAKATAAYDQLLTVVAFSDGKKTCDLMVSPVGGFLFIFDSSKPLRVVTVVKALRWYRRNLRQNWFTSRKDNDDGWLLFLGMAEGLCALYSGR